MVSHGANNARAHVVHEASEASLLMKKGYSRPVLADYGKLCDVTMGTSGSDEYGKVPGLGDSISPYTRQA
jgi:hypothetical protein